MGSRALREAANYLGTKQPSLFVIKGILESVYKGTGYNHRARYSELATCTPEIRNRKRLGEYLNLLTEDLGWLEKKEELTSSVYNPISRSQRKKWYESWYYLTPKGTTFISLFPQEVSSTTDNDRATSDEDKILISKRVLKRPGLYAIKSILENTKLGFFSFSDLADITEGSSNRKNLLAYLKLLCDELGWMERKKQLRTHTPIYSLTQLGQSFLSLFENEKKIPEVEKAE